jgi:hypothetical protein
MDPGGLDSDPEMEVLDTQPDTSVAENGLVLHVGGKDVLILEEEAQSSKVLAEMLALLKHQPPEEKGHAHSIPSVPHRHMQLIVEFLKLRTSQGKLITAAEIKEVLPGGEPSRPLTSMLSACAHLRPLLGLADRIESLQPDDMITLLRSCTYMEVPAMEAMVAYAFMYYVKVTPEDQVRMNMSAGREWEQDTRRRLEESFKRDPQDKSLAWYEMMQNRHE